MKFTRIWAAILSENYFLNAKIIISLNKKAPKQREEFQAFWKNNGCGGAKSVMNDLKNRGVNDVYVFCVDGLAGFRVLKMRRL